MNCKGEKRVLLINGPYLSNVISNNRQSFSSFVVLFKSTCLCLFYLAGKLQELEPLYNNLWLYTAEPPSSLCT